MSQVELFDDKQVVDRDYDNPMVVLYGKGPAEKCKSCNNLIRIQPGQNKYYKCELRGITHGPGTDHRVNYRACAMYKKE